MADPDPGKVDEGENVAIDNFADPSEAGLRLGEFVLPSGVSMSLRLLSRANGEYLVSMGLRVVKI